MVRPATPLTILLFVSFVLLLLSVISTPIVEVIPIATYQGVNFGVFGYCKGSQCSGIKIGYNTGSNTASYETPLSSSLMTVDALFTSNTNSKTFTQPSGPRHTLTTLIAEHP